MIIDTPQDSQIPALRKLWQQAFGDPEEFLDRFFRLAFAKERCRCVTVRDTTVAALYWFDCTWGSRKAAYVYAVATDSAFQGKGFCKALLEDTHLALKAQGYACAVLVPGEEKLFCLYEKCGYRVFCPMEENTLTAGNGAVSFRQISATEYAAMQKRLAPENSILHQPETLAFASGFLKFYAGADLIFCCSEEDGTAQFQEFLGDAARLPGILAGLGVSEGRVRLPGGNGCAMYHPLEAMLPVPEYFGIPLN